MSASSHTAIAVFDYLPPRRRSRLHAAGRLARDNPVGVVAVAVLLTVIVMAVFAEIIAPYRPTELTGKSFVGPESGTILGTDRIGRDVFSRMLYGARVSLQVGIIAVVLGTLTGSFIGIVSGYFGGWLDLIVQRLMDVQMAIPALLLAMVVVAAFGRGSWNAMYAIAIVLIPGTARVVRSSTLGLRARQFVEAASASGATNARVLWRHVIPNAVDEIIVLASVALGSAIIIEAALSFLGLGTQAPDPSWGSMLAEGQLRFERGPHMVYVPAAFISVTVLAFTMLGDTVRDILDPKVRGGGKGHL